MNQVEKRWPLGNSMMLTIQPIVDQPVKQFHNAFTKCFQLNENVYEFEYLRSNVCRVQFGRACRK